VSAGGRVLITGGSRGIGLAVAQRLAADGRPVTLCARGREALDEAVAQLPGEGHRALALDVADAASWRGAAAELADVSGLVCAAGVIGPIGAMEDVDPAAFADTLRVNVAGVLLAVQACAAGLRAPGGAAVVFSGGGATGPFARFDADAASKAAVVRLAENLAAEGLRINAVAPGFIVTAMQSDVLDAGPGRVGEAYYERVRAAAAGERPSDDPARAAELVALLLSPAAEGISGKLLSAPWDPWEDPAFLERLRSERDLATLRRIDDQFFTAMGGA
jgi:NAD(P)-dependent dehydrogenase (short-subunit alcohol dehydrogenase family)